MAQSYRQYIIPKDYFSRVQSALRSVEVSHDSFVRDGLEYFVFADSKAHMPVKAKIKKTSILNIVYSTDFMPRYYKPVVEGLTERKRLSF